LFFKGRIPKLSASFLSEKSYFPQHVDVRPRLRRMSLDGFHHFGVGFGIGRPKARFEIEIIPADNGVLHQAVAGFGHLLIFLQGNVDTGGVSDMSFALCHLVGFQLVPRLRGLKDRRLYLFLGDTPPENLAPLVGEPINVERIKANWNDILRLVTTIRSGQVRPSTLLAKLSAFPRRQRRRRS